MGTALLWQFAGQAHSAYVLERASRRVASRRVMLCHPVSCRVARFMSCLAVSRRVVYCRVVSSHTREESGHSTSHGRTAQIHAAHPHTTHTDTTITTNAHAAHTSTTHFHTTHSLTTHPMRSRSGIARGTKQRTGPLGLTSLGSCMCVCAAFQALQKT